VKKIFLDSDVLLDLLLDRAPFANDISILIEYAITNDVVLYTSPISITNINYIIEKIETRSKANLKTKKILEIVKIENVGQKAKLSKFKDFEDAVQNFCAVESNHKIIVTRNTKDYKESDLSIFTAREYFAKIQAE